MKTQKELKIIFEKEVRDYWKSESMVKHCLKESNYLIELEDGNLLSIDKPRIKKDFCFGWSTHDQEGYDNANEMVGYVRKNEDYFRNENLRGLKEQIENLKKNFNRNIWVFSHYTGQTKESKLFTWTFEGHWSTTAEYIQEHYQNARLMTDKEKQELIKGFEEVLKQFSKRVETYLKKYGLTKVNSWSYWRDA